jgi:integrase
MPSIRKREDNGCLFLDFRFQGQRCREQTLLPDTPANRAKLKKVLDRIEEEISAGSFVYENYFPNSKALKRLVRHRDTRQDESPRLSWRPVGLSQAANAVA